MPYFSRADHHLFYREWGSGPLLLILPGNTASSACHEGELQHFGQRHRAVALDFWGTGRSDRLARWPDDWWVQGAHDAVALAEHLNVERCIALGTSGGANVALWMAILYPHRVRAVIADSTMPVYPPGFFQAGMADRARRTPGQVAFWSRAHGDDWEQVVDADSAMLLRQPAGVDTFRGRQAQIACPVLLTASLADDMLPDVGAQLPALVRQIPDARLYLNNRGGHPLMWSCPGEFRALCDLFLSQLP